MKKLFSSILIICFFILNLLGCANSSKNKKIERIVSLGPSATEILFAIGAESKIVARTDFCDYPKEALLIPSVGGFSATNISIESILSFEPDMVYLFSGMHDSLIKPLENLGIKVFVSNCSSIKDTQNEILEVGKITGFESNAKKVVEQMNNKLNAISLNVEKVKSKNPQKECRLFWQLWDDPLMSVGKNSFINDIITQAGWQNIFSDVEQAYPFVSAEAAIRAKPDFIVIDGSARSYENANENEKAAFEKAVFETELMKILLTQKKETGKYIIEQNYASRPVPRLVNVVEDLSEKLIQMLEVENSD